MHRAIGNRTSGDPLRTATEVLLQFRGDANQSSLVRSCLACLDAAFDQPQQACPCHRAGRRAPETGATGKSKDCSSAGEESGGKRLLQGASDYLIDATAPASDSSGHELTAKIAPKQSNSTKWCQGASDCKKSLLISRNDRDPRGMIFDVGFISWPSDLSISIGRNSPPLPDSSKTGPRQVTKGEDCVTNRSRDFMQIFFATLPNGNGEKLSSSFLSEHCLSR